MFSTFRVSSRGLPQPGPTSREALRPRWASRSQTRETSPSEKRRAERGGRSAGAQTPQRSAELGVGALAAVRP